MLPTNVKDILKYFLKNAGMLILFVFIILIIGNSIQLLNISKSAKNILNSTNDLNAAISTKDVTSALKISNKLNSDAKILRENLNNIKLLQFIPLLDQNINSIDNLADILILTTNTISELEPLIKENANIFLSTTPDKLEIVSMPKDTKKQILLSIKNNTTALDIASKNLMQIINIIDKNKYENKNLISQLDSVWNKIYENKKTIENISGIMPVLKAAPDLLGNDNENAKYLLLLQNNTELRPTGGFIGTYGLIYISNGDIKNIFTDNIYNLDVSAIKRVNIEAPEAMKKYLDVQKLYLRDANWNPDYPQTAKFIESLYKKESLNNEKIQGVIAITPELLRGMISYFGEIKVDGMVFNKDNVVDLLNYETKFGYWDKSLKPNQRKIIIQKLSNVLFEEVKSLSLTDLKNFFEIIRSSLNTKSLMLYFTNPEIQNFIEDKEWAGKMNDNNMSDYIQVVDANMKSGKVDEYVKRSIDYDLKYINGELIAKLSITYNYQLIDNGIYKDDPSYTNFYKSYTRIYVPKGSWLNTARREGNEILKKDISFGIENDRTSFGLFVSIPKNTSATYTFEYKLPKEITDSLLEKYILSIQKQAGLKDIDINITIDLGKSIKEHSVSPDYGLKTKAYNTVFNTNGYTAVDRNINILFYKKSDISIIRNTIKKNYLSFDLKEY